MRHFAHRHLPVSLATLILLCAAATLHAQGGVVNTGSAPEIDPSMIGAGAALLGGLALVIRSRRSHQRVGIKPFNR